MLHRTTRSFVLAALLLPGVFATPAAAGTVPVHDPSIVVVYKDANGNSYPENDAGATRTKHYYVFGTMLGAAHSTDMANWTEFTPSMSLNGATSTDYYAVFKAEGDYAEHVTSDDLKGNLWAPDVVYNKNLKKWCMYISLSGAAFKSSIVMLTSTKVEGPYAKAGVVVYGGFTNSATSVGRTDYQKVIGSSSIDARYLKSGAWNNDYAPSCIDPNIFYDRNGRLWMVYGSWSGGIFLLKLDESTGLRSGSWNYGYTAPTWTSGTHLRYDPYFGLHISGGWYVSGEGPYIRYLQDPDGKNGYYYLFNSMGFYSPEGGYTIRVFRSPTVDGFYTDVTGDSATFGKYLFNYGSNMTRGFPLVMNYKWNDWSMAGIAQGHNSAMQDEDGNAYIVWHRKYDNGTAWHKVEVHQLFFNDKGWIVAAPHAYRKGYGLRRSAYSIDEIAGVYGTIFHGSVDYANLKSNTEKEMRLNADGTITGAYTGTWTYNWSNGRQFLKLETNAGVFRGVLADQLVEGSGARTVGFTGLDVDNEKALWAYRRANTAKSRTILVHDHSLKIGGADTTLAWNAYDSFRKDTASGDFEAEYEFVNGTKAAENWHNWSLALQNGTQTWHLRADSWSVGAFSGSTVTYKTDWNGAIDYKSVFKNKKLRLKVRKVGTTIDVFAFVDSTLATTTTAANCPTGSYTLLLGGENVLLDVSKVKISSLGTRQLLGKDNDDGTFAAAFNTLYTDTATVSGDFHLNFRFVNQHNATSQNNWDNWILRSISGGKTMLLRADAYALEPQGTVAFTLDWDWTKFNALVTGAEVSLDIRRSATTVTHATAIAAKDGTTWHSTALQTGAPSGAISYGLTNEASLVDLLEIERATHVGQDPSTTTSAHPAVARTERPMRLRVQGRDLLVEADRPGEADLLRADGRAAVRVRWQAGATRVPSLRPGLHLLGGQRILVP